MRPLRAEEPAAELPADALWFTVLTNEDGPMTKSFELDEKGRLVKSAAAFLCEGRAEIHAAHELPQFVEALDSLRLRQAVTYGVPARRSGRVVKSDEVHRTPSAIARSREFFGYRRGPSIMMLDHDADHLPDRFDRNGLRERLLRAVPELQVAPMAWRPSASSGICGINGEPLTGLSGQRLYLPVADGSTVPACGKLIYERLWADGCGAFMVSQSGMLLDRNLFDASVFQPERLDFAAAPRLGPGLTRGVPSAYLWEGFDGFTPAPLDFMLEPMTGAQRDAAAANRDAARRRAEPLRLERRSAYINEQAEELAQHAGVTIEQARKVVGEAVDRGLLFAEFILYPEHGDPVTVGQVLDDPSRWHNKRFADPIEPNYRGDRRAAWCNLYSGGRPYVFSHAHGGRRFELVRQPKVLQVQAGSESRLADDCLEVIRKRGDLYDFGSTTIARVVDGRLYTATPTWMRDYLGRHIRFERWDKRTKASEPTAVPKDVAAAIVDRAGERGLPALRAVITAPTLRSDGSILDHPGFDVATGLLYLNDDPEATALRVPESPTRPEVLAALRTLFEPFKAFPFDSPASRGVQLAALLTAVIRRAVPTAPAFAIDAPAPGTGKSLNARCIAALGGHDAASFTPPGNDEEVRKLLFAALREGAGSIIFDNLTGPLGGAPINQFITEPLFAGRVLGSSENASLPNAALFLVTANNFRAHADTCRRVLVCRLDAGVEQPYRRQFDFDPLQFVRRRRLPLTLAALTLIRGHIAAGGLRLAAPLGSFEDWDRLVRQTVIWLGQIQDELPLADPAETIDASTGQDEHRGTLATALEAWSAAFGDSAVTAADALKVAEGDAVDVDDARADALRAAFVEIASERGSVLNPKRLGNWLLAHRGEIADGRRFVQRMNRSKVSVWAAESVEG
jgi:hypothetical protein